MKARAAFALGLLLVGSAVSAQPVEAPAPVAAPASAPAAAPEKSWTVPAAEIVVFDFLLNRYNHRFSGSSDYDVTAASIRRNLRGPWVTDNDPFSVNQFAHPYQGALYHGAGRSTGLSYWEASALIFRRFGTTVW